MVTPTEFDNIFVSDLPMIDVRAPVEFDRGAFRNAVNLPILNDEERRLVGTCYKESGAAAAQDLGYELVSGETRQARLNRWIRFLEDNPGALLYCFRGGQRSQIACEWLKSEGYEVQRISGGFKALRQHLLSVFDQLPPLVVVSGQTGCGKTEFLADFVQSIDLEGFANHRGSAFGARITPQPSQISFENEVAAELIRHRIHDEVLLEDESRLIGRIHLPVPLQEKMKQAPILAIEEPLDVRTERIYDEYIELQWSDYERHFGEDALTEFEQYLLTAVDAIRRRLGNVAHDEIRTLILNALERQAKDGLLEGHRDWIALLLSDYYDPMYNYQLGKKSDRVVVKGPRNVVTEWYEKHQGTLL